MERSTNELLRQLGRGLSIEAVCRAVGMTRREFDDWWQETLHSRVPRMNGRRPAAVDADVRIERDRWGIPHVLAASDEDLFFGFGYAMAQDRLFQLDYLRRKGLGRLSEVLGPESLPLDTIARTVGLHRIAAAEWDRLSGKVRQILESFAAGINAVIEDSREQLPIEFALLDYQPEPWSPVDCLAIESEFRWYLTGRFPVIVMPEMAKHVLGEGELYDEFLLGEADEESILQPGEYAARPKGEGASGPLEPIGHTMNDPDAAIGSNNWVIAGDRTATGQPLLASDPHIAFEAVSCWYQAHLCGGSFNVAGMSYVGIPAILFGRNERVAWGITNNICSQRDLYQEKLDPRHPGSFTYDGHPEPARERVEVIHVRDGEVVTKTIRFSRHGPVVDEILPSPADQAGPVTLKWLGAYQGGWLTSLLAMDRAPSVEAFREALRPWHVPTFSLVIADVEGNIAYQAAGRIPLRRQLERGYRPGWDPDHDWQGLIPFEHMPCVVNPQRGWLATANNRPAPDDYANPLFGCWSSGWRAQRIRQMIESSPKVTLGQLRQMQHDTKSLRAAALVPPLIAELSAVADLRMAEARQHLEAWDYRCDADSVAATIFNVFFSHWCHTVASQRFDEPVIELMITGVGGCAGRLLSSDPVGWFSENDREETIVNTFERTLDMLTQRLGEDMSTWSWGRLHTLPLKHVLAGRGDLGDLLNHAGAEVPGDMWTVCNTGCGPNWEATTGAGYRLLVDLAASPPRLLAVDAASQSGHLGSPHYADQFSPWLEGKYHEISLVEDLASAESVDSLTLEPSV